MKLKQALSNIFQVKGQSTVIGAVMSRDFSSIQAVLLAFCYIPVI